MILMFINKKYDKKVYLKYKNNTFNYTMYYQTFKIIKSKQKT